MKFIALVSGGKDSCFNIIHCLNAGHELVAMANLHPKPDRPDEIDSWMFQTVGYKAVTHIAECAGVPLFRAEISEDEDAVVDEMAALFLKIKTQIEFEAVSVGAIGSTYQQVRVDKACEATGLRALTYLWQRDQSDLLREIVASGLDARVVKVAGMGLGERHLGKPLRALEGELLEMHQSFGLHPCGEGGEYETMVFDAPFFNTHRLAIVPGTEKVVSHSTDDVFYLEFEVTTEPKDEPLKLIEVAVPPLLSPESTELLEKPEIEPHAYSSDPWPTSMTCTDRRLGPKHVAFTAYGTFEEALSAVKSLFERQQNSTEENIYTCYHVALVLKSMSRFAEMNALYIKTFQKSVKKLGDIPPSRACIQAAIPWDIEITVYQTTKADPSAKGIHVQGLSYWAPASIGPYSQCRLAFGISYVAGQIALIPQSLAVIYADANSHALLALQNSLRVLNVVHESQTNWTPRVAIVYITQSQILDVVNQIWKRVSSIPLIVAVVEELPRGACVEWSIQACDLRYFSWFVPDSDEDEEYYSATPEILYSSTSGYVHRAGFQVLNVRCNTELADANFVISPNNRSTSSRHWIPVNSVYYDGNEVNEIYIAAQ